MICIARAGKSSSSSRLSEFQQIDIERMYDAAYTFYPDKIKAVAVIHEIYGTCRIGQVIKFSWSCYNGACNDRINMIIAGRKRITGNIIRKCQQYAVILVQRKIIKQ